MDENPILIWKWIWQDDSTNLIGKIFLTILSPIAFLVISWFWLLDFLFTKHGKS